MDDVTRVLPQIARSGRHMIYNVAGGTNTSHREIFDAVRRATGCRIEVADGSPTVYFPPVSIERVRQEFGFSPYRVLDSLPDLISAYQRRSWTT